jgi:uncharacterized damage-inducible protein DinB
MNTQQEQWATQIRQIPTTFYQAIRSTSDQAIRRRPALEEWSAIEVLGHMIDKMTHWSNRIEHILREERPFLPEYDQDREVYEHKYQQADPEVLHERLQQHCERFATLVASLPSSALQREGVHSDYGPMTIQQCIETPLASVSEHLEQLSTAQTM